MEEKSAAFVQILWAPAGSLPMVADPCADALDLR
jgi:hypothetical protein